MVSPSWELEDPMSYDVYELVSIQINQSYVEVDNT